MSEHEYSLLGGFSRAKVGRYLSLLSAGFSAIIVFVLLWTVDVAHKFGLPGNLPPSVLSLVGAGGVFTVLYWLFDKYAWKWPPINIMLNVPDLSGNWTCTGDSLDLSGNVVYSWTGVVTIVQSWDKISVNIRTPQSISKSKSAAIVRDKSTGYRLFYSYRNDPNISQTTLHSHRGFAELDFDKDLSIAEGEYFNGYGRFSFGRMQLKRQ